MVHIKRVQVLYLEHNDDSYKLYSDHIRAYWREATLGEMEFTQVKTVEDAIMQLQSGSQQFDIFLSDILFPPIHNPNAKPEDHEPRGIEAIKVAARSPKLLIIGLSVGGSKRFPEAKSDAIASGADLFKYVGVDFGINKTERFILEVI